MVETVESSTSKSDPKTKAAVQYLRTLGERERQFRAYVDASLDAKLFSILKPENSLPADIDAGKLRQKTQDDFLELRNQLVPYHAEQEGYVHPLLQRLSEWTDTRYSIHEERRQLQNILHEYTQNVHQHDTYSRQRALQKAQQALEKRRNIWSSRKPLPSSVTINRPDLPKSGQSTTTGNIKTSRKHHIEEKLYAITQMEENIWTNELQQLKEALDLAEEIGKVASHTDNIQSLVRRCSEWEAELLKLARTVDGTRLANAIRPQIVSLKATGSVYSQMDTFEKSQHKWQNQMNRVHVRSQKTKSFVDNFIINLNPFAPSFNHDIRTLSQHTANVEEFIKQFNMSYQHQTNTFSDAHRTRIEQRWKSLTQSHSAACKKAWSQMNESFEKTNREFEASVYSHGLDSSNSRTLNERRQLFHTILQKMESLHQPSSFENDPRVVKTNLRVKQHENMIRIRDTASRFQWTKDTLLKQKQLWEAYDKDANVHEATVLAAKTVYLTGRTSLLTNAYHHVEDAVVESLSSGPQVPNQLKTQGYKQAVDVYDQYVRTFPPLVELSDETEVKFTDLKDFVEQWPSRWQMVRKASEAKDYDAWSTHSNKIVQVAPKGISTHVRSLVEQGKPSPIKPMENTQETIVQPEPSYPSAWTWPWWNQKDKGPAESKPTNDVHKDINEDMVHTLDEQKQVWEAFVKNDQVIQVNTNHPESQTTYQQLNALHQRVVSLRKLSAHYDRLYERASVEERRIHNARDIQKTQHRYLQEAEKEYTTAENKLATHWKDVKKTFMVKQKTMNKKIAKSQIHDVLQRFTVDERVRRFNEIVSSTQYEQAYRKAAQVPLVSVGRLGSSLRIVTDSLREQAVHSNSPEVMLEQLPRETYSPFGELGEYLVKTDMLKQFGELNTTRTKDIIRMDKERQYEDTVKLPKEYQTTQGLQQTLMMHLHVGAPGSTLDKETFLKRFDQNLPFYGFKAEFEALSMSHSFRVALIIEQSSQMMKVLDLKETPKTTLDLAKIIWNSPTSIEKLDRRLHKALETFEKMPAYKGAHKKHRHVSIEGIRIATWHQIRRHIGSYALSFITKSSQRLELPEVFSSQNPFLQDLRTDGLHPNDHYELSKLFGDDTLKDLLVLTVKRQEANESNPLGKAFEQYMVNHANTYETNPYLKTLQRSLNLVHANIRETRPTFDWRVATFELVEAGVLELDTIQLVLGRPRNEAKLTDLRTLLTSEKFTKGLSKRLLKRLSRSSILVGDNPDFWKTTRADVNLEHTGELHRIQERYPFLIESSYLKK